MQLDSELQRQQLLACIRDTNVTGTFQQVAEAVPVMHALVDAVSKATIAEATAVIEIPDSVDNVQ